MLTKRKRKLIPKRMSKIVLGIRVEPSLKERLAAIAEKENRSLSRQAEKILSDAADAADRKGRR